MLKHTNTLPPPRASYPPHTHYYHLHHTSHPLPGTIHAALGNLIALTSLAFMQNHELVGKIPNELGKLFNMETLRIFGRKLDGTIPVELSNMNKLVALEIRSVDPADPPSTSKFVPPHRLQCFCSPAGRECSFDSVITSYGEDNQPNICNVVAHGAAATCSGGQCLNCKVATASPEYECYAPSSALSCPLGTGDSGASTCVACAAGKYSDTTDATPCKPKSVLKCAVGSGYVEGTSSVDSSCVTCAAGTSSDVVDGSPCTGTITVKMKNATNAMFEGGPLPSNNPGLRKAEGTFHSHALDIVLSAPSTSVTTVQVQLRAAVSGTASDATNGGCSLSTMHGGAQSETIEVKMFAGQIAGQTRSAFGGSASSPHLSCTSQSATGVVLLAKTTGTSATPYTTFQSPPILVAETLTGTMTLDVDGGVEWSGSYLVHAKYWLELKLSAASLGDTQVTIEVTPSANGGCSIHTVSPGSDTPT